MIANHLFDAQVINLSTCHLPDSSHTSSHGSFQQSDSDSRSVNQLRLGQEAGDQQEGWSQVVNTHRPHSNPLLVSRISLSVPQPPSLRHQVDGGGRPGESNTQGTGQVLGDAGTTKGKWLCLGGQD